MSAASDLERIAQMVVVLRALQKNVAQAEQALAKANADLKRIEQEDFVDLMRECDLKEVTLMDGTTLKLADDVHCSITVERRPIAHEWLRSHGFGGLIKTALTIPFGKDEEKAMHEAEIMMIKLGRRPERYEAVHPQTLKAFVREQREKGESPPEDIFSINPYSKVVAKDAK